MKKKYIKITAIIVLILFLLIYGRILIKYKPSRLICVAKININNPAGYIGYNDHGFRNLNREDLEGYLKMVSETESPYVVLNQQEIDGIVDAANQYGHYPTVILSDINSKVFWTRYRSPHIGYMNIHQIRSDGKLTYDDVLYVYVTKCTEIDDEPLDWQWRPDLW